MPGNGIATLVEQHNRTESEGERGAFGDWMGVDCTIHPNDEIFRFFYSHPSSVNPVRDYLADGWRTLCELMVFMEHLDRSLVRTGSLLEFASGYGRFTRHLARFLDPRIIHAADVMPGSAEFVEARFGVSSFYSSSDPQALGFARGFDVVFVLSLFSHLPRDTWQLWLHKLFMALNPGGVLIFSTHGSGFAKRQGVVLDVHGFHFIPSSESSHLEASDYGSTITSESFVRDAIAQLPGGRVDRFTPDHFWSAQDAWAVRRENKVG